MKERTLSVKLSSQVYQQFKVKASEQGYLIKDVVLKLVKLYSRGKFDGSIKSKNNG